MVLKKINEEKQEEIKKAMEKCQIRIYRVGKIEVREKADWKVKRNKI